MSARIYLAGPDVFRPDALAYGEHLKALCAEAGFEGLFPLDNAGPDNALEPPRKAAWIYRANLALLDRADLVLANLNFFRGAEPDSGTCFEVGYAVAKGKPVYAYVQEPGDYAERLAKRFPEQCGGPGLDVDGWSIEQFSLPVNLMLGVSSRVVYGDFRCALAALSASWKPGR